MNRQRKRELIARYAWPGATLKDAESCASRMAWMQEDDQPVDDETLSQDIDEMRAVTKKQTSSTPDTYLPAIQALADQVAAHLDYSDDVEMQIALENAQDAIAKAKGEKP